MNINVLTIKAQQALQSAVSVAQQAGQQAVEPLHLLSVIVEQKDELGAFLLGRCGVNLTNLRSGVTEALSRLPKVSGGGEQYFATDTTKVIQRAVDFTKKFNDKYASIEHLLLALVAEHGTASELLKSHGVSEGDLIEAIRQFRKGSTVDSQSDDKQFDALSNVVRTV